MSMCDDDDDDDDDDIDDDIIIVIDVCLHELHNLTYFCFVELFLILRMSLLLIS